MFNQIAGFYGLCCLFTDAILYIAYGEIKTMFSVGWIIAISFLLIIRGDDF